MPSFSDSIFLFLLALLLFGPKKLPVLARELGKWIGEFRRASNEFKMQMEEELRQVEQADRQKQIVAMEAAAPVAPIPEPEHPHLTRPDLDTSTETDTDASTLAEPTLAENTPGVEAPTLPPIPAIPQPGSSLTPLPIATSGSLSIMPPATGLPTPRSRPGSDNQKPNPSPALPSSDPLGSLIDSRPTAPGMNGSHSETDELTPNTPPQLTPETAAHGH